MKQGTVSVLFGCHSIFHCSIVVVAWIRLYHKLPRLWELTCIYLHDIGHWGTQYLDNYEDKKAHWVLGARVAKCLFGQKGYDLIAGHSKEGGQAISQLYKPDKFSWIIAPTWWMITNTWFEPKLVRPGNTRRESALMFKAAMLDNWNNGLTKGGHEIYLSQWRGIEKV